MSWDYMDIKGEFWNNKPSDEQLQLLERYYPIGWVFHHKSPLDNFNGSYGIGSNISQDPEDYIAIIDDHHLYVSGGVLQGVPFYILKIRNIGSLKTIRGEFETIHPGFYYPDKQYSRDK